jgi:HK97 gp10 family phage protein
MAALSFEISIDVREDVTERTRGARERVRRGLRSGLEEAGAEIERYAKSIVPVRTGFLRSSIFHRASPTQLAVGAAAPYALYVEFGTRRMAARPYIRPAVFAKIGELQRMIASAVVEALGG